MVRTFVDTSALLKKYIHETGADEFERLIAQTTDIAVSPITWVEMHAALARKTRVGAITPDQAKYVIHEARSDYRHFRHVRWTDALVEKSCEIADQFQIKTLDSIQLASGVLSIADCFVTADVRLFIEAKKLLKSVLV